MSNLSNSNHRRGCGSRAAGGVYAKTRLSPFGRPIEDFLVDPPQAVDLNELGLTAVGVKLVELNGVWHLFDVVGSVYYPYPADYVEETRRMGASRRLPRNLDFGKLTPESCLVLIHSKSIIQNFAEYPQPPEVSCPKALDAHRLTPLGETCAGLWWHDILADEMEVDDGGIFLRRVADTKYRAYPRPDDVKPQYQHGIFLVLSITNLVVIRGRNDQEIASAEQAFQAASRSALPVYLEEE